jgi:hypothetical protein
MRHHHTCSAGNPTNNVVPIGAVPSVISLFPLNSIVHRYRNRYRRLKDSHTKKQKFPFQEISIVCKMGH